MYGPGRGLDANTFAVVRSGPWAGVRAGCRELERLRARRRRRRQGPLHVGPEPLQPQRVRRGAARTSRRPTASTRTPRSSSTSPSASASSATSTRRSSSTAATCATSPTRPTPRRSEEDRRAQGPVGGEAQVEGGRAAVGDRAATSPPPPDKPARAAAGAGRAPRAAARRPPRRRHAPPPAPVTSLSPEAAATTTSTTTPGADLTAKADTGESEPHLQGVVVLGRRGRRRRGRRRHRRPRELGLRLGTLFTARQQEGLLGWRPPCFGGSRT